MADLPIPFTTVQAFRAAGQNCRNLGLLFDRFVSYGQDWAMEGGQKHDEALRLVNACNSWAGDSAYKAMYRAMLDRWKKVMESSGATPFEATPEWRLIIGLGRESAFETGLTLHRVYGFPYVPGSALKGMTRAWAEANHKVDLKTIFGTEDQAGSVIFFDALPVSPPILKLDVMNPHYPEYYRSGDNKQPPADWQSPVPVYFITIERGTRFLFGVGSRKGDKKIASQPLVWLRKALAEIGIGGKTTSGYGVFSL